MIRFTIFLFCILTISSTSYKEVEKISFKDFKYLIVNEPTYQVFIPKMYKTMVLNVCKKYDIPIYILARLIEKESNWSRYATNINTNGTIDLGITQINSDNIEEFTWKYNDFKPIDFENPLMCMEISAQYLKDLYTMFGNWKEAIMAYNAGFMKVKKNKVPSSTIQYVTYILHIDWKKIERNTNDRANEKSASICNIVW